MSSVDIPEGNRNVFCRFRYIQSGSVAGRPHKKGCMLRRNVLWYLVFAGFGVNYMVRINLNIAIVSMVDGASRKGNVARNSSECFTPILKNDSAILQTSINETVRINC